MLNECLVSLKKGFPIIFPTETVYGIGVDLFNDDAAKLLYRIKKRNIEKPFSMHYHKIDVISQYAVINEKVEKIIEKFLPGPLTLVLMAKENAPKTVVRNGKIGIRIVKNDRFSEFMDIYGKPIIGTSVNESGCPPLSSPEQINKSIFSVYPIIKDGVKPNSPSTVVDCTTEPFTILRKGDVIKELERYL